MGLVLPLKEENLPLSHVCVSRSWEDAEAGDLFSCQPTKCVSMRKRQDYVKNDSGLFLELNSFSHFRRVNMEEGSEDIEAHVFARCHTCKNQISLFLWWGVLQMTVMWRDQILSFTSNISQSEWHWLHSSAVCDATPYKYNLLVFRHFSWQLVVALAEAHL